MILQAGMLVIRMKTAHRCTRLKRSLHVIPAPREESVNRPQGRPVRLLATVCRRRLWLAAFSQGLPVK